MSIAQQVAVNELQIRLGALEARVRAMERSAQSIEVAAARLEASDAEFDQAEHDSAMEVALSRIKPDEVPKLNLEGLEDDKTSHNVSAQPKRRGRPPKVQS